jgi:LysR family glycine cleavage system transcriptional activator
MPYIDDWRLWLTAAGATGVDPEHGPRFDNNLAAYKAAEEGLGVAIGRGRLLEGALASGRLVAPFEIRLATRHAYYFACAEGSAHISKVAAFRAWLIAEVTHIRAGEAPRSVKEG